MKTALQTTVVVLSAGTILAVLFPGGERVAVTMICASCAVLGILALLSKKGGGRTE